MKQLFAFLALCLVFSFASIAKAQQLSIRVTANSTIVTDGRIELKDQKRIQWFVQDGMPLNAGYAYEFGPVLLIGANGQASSLKAKDVVNGPVFHYSVSKHLFQQYPQGFELRVEQIVRHNPNGTTETLPFSKEDLTIKVVPATN